jgi:type IV secretory pathway ATPase VirB11/archaellum biosynthesis ATPase
VATGEATGDSGVCSKQSMAQWAEREATEEEKAKLNRDQAVVKEIAEAFRYFENALRNAPDEMLLDEVRRRGLKLEDE